jgi:uncharacterized membrane protein (UPF0127 family)
MKKRKWRTGFFIYAVFLSALVLEALPTRKISIGEQILTVEIADTLERVNKGLMFRAALLDGHGMLFIYSKPHILSFWMKNTYIALSIAFFDQNKILLNTADMPPFDKSPNLPEFKSIAPALYALEVPQGWFKKHKINPGVKFTFHDQ